MLKKGHAGVCLEEKGHPVGGMVLKIKSNSWRRSEGLEKVGKDALFPDDMSVMEKQHVLSFYPDDKKNREDINHGFCPALLTRAQWDPIFTKFYSQTDI